MATKARAKRPRNYCSNGGHGYETTMKFSVVMNPGQHSPTRLTLGFCSERCVADYFETRATEITLFGAPICKLCDGLGYEIVNVDEVDPRKHFAPGYPDNAMRCVRCNGTGHSK